MSSVHVQNPSVSAPFAVGLARASWLCPIAVVVFGGVGRQILGKSILIDLISFAVALVGLGLGIAALFGVRRYGRKRILAPALTGIGINGFLLLVWVSNFLAAYARARAAAGRS